MKTRKFCPPWNIDLDFLLIYETRLYTKLTKISLQKTNPDLTPDHTNYSTKTMRAGTEGMEYINNMMKRFSAKHDLHIALYGDDN